MTSLRNMLSQRAGGTGVEALKKSINWKVENIESGYHILMASLEVFYPNYV